MSKIAEATTFAVEGLRYNWTMMRLRTDDGITGWGEATNWPGSPLVEAACRHIGERIIGEDADRIDYLWNKLYRDMHWLGQAGPLLSAISAVDIALWDIKGKRLDVPVYELLGGAYRDRIRLYANYWFSDVSHAAADYAQRARETVAKGFSALKFDPFAHVSYSYGSDLAASGDLTEKQKQHALDLVAAVAEAAGPEVPLAIETHAFLNGPTAVEMAHRLEDLNFNCMWYEEPALPEFVDQIAEIRSKISLPVCVGERLHTRFMAKQVLDAGAADILMPDIVRCGGLSEMRKIATLAEAYNVPIAPHNPNGPISTIASAHAMAATPNFFRQEFFVQDVPWRDECLSHPLPVVDGYFELPTRPGIGFELDEEVLTAHPAVREVRNDRRFYV
jgi:galactonate dehydratase